MLIRIEFNNYENYTYAYFKLPCTNKSIICVYVVEYYPNDMHK